MMIATLNTNSNSLKLTSIMRDTYVQIPGYSDNRINTAYRTGDIPLLYDTIEKNFNIKLDGYMKVDYNAFEKIIDLFGGVEVTLTKDEAEYLNTTNYISKKKYRTVKPGKQTMNGNQALGYSRVRKRRTINDTPDDFGRTERQRIVLNAIFEKYGSKSFPEVALLAKDIFGLITTDVDKWDMLSYSKTIVSMDVSNLETLNVPVTGSFSFKDIRGMDVMVPDLKMNIDAIQEFIYGEGKE